MWIKLIILCLILLVIFSLAQALLPLMGKTSTKPMSYYLGKRLVFSALVVLLVIISKHWQLI